MNIFDYINAGEIAAYIQSLPSNQVPYLGATLFPNRTHTGTDISWLKGSTGLPITIQPSEYDTKATLRERTGFGKVATEMAFFREALRIGEKDRQLMNNLSSRSLGMAQPIINNIFDDVNKIVMGVEAQAEYMRMQLMQYGKFTVASLNGNAKYVYDYSMNADHQLDAAVLWSSYATSNPITDIVAAMDVIEEDTGVRPTRIIMNRTTFKAMVASESIKKSLMIGVTGNWQDLRISNAEAQQYIERETESLIQVYSKKVATFDNVDLITNPENTRAVSLVDDGMVILLPESTLGNTWYGTTPEASDLANGNTAAQVQVIANGPTITTYKEVHPVNVNTIVSAVMIPSFESIDNVATIKVFA